jgi:DNA (cytosine-5)-methyltransferase 1
VLTVGSLFSGIGGLDLGLERAGMQVIWQSEIDPYACKVLQKHWPEVPNYGNIKEIDWRNIVRPDVICGGYPCQPFSQAGKRQGEKDERHLWPWVKDAISVLRPRYAILENVRGHLTLGGTTVIGELAEIGYDAEWRVVSAASVGANHRRDRIIIVAYPSSKFFNDGRHGDSQGTLGERQAIQGEASRSSSAMADADSERLEGSRPEQQTTRLARSGEESGRDLADAHLWETSGGLGWNGTDRSAVFGGEHQRRGTAGYAGREWWQVEPGMGRVANGVPNRVDRLRGLGNAVVPQVAEVIGRIVVDHAQHN